MKIASFTISMESSSTSIVPQEGVCSEISESNSQGMRVGGGIVGEAFLESLLCS